MTASSRGCRAAIAVIRTLYTYTYRLEQCGWIGIQLIETGTPRLSNISRTRTYATTAPTLTTLTPEPNTHLAHISSLPPVSPIPNAQPKIKAGILLSRPPLLTRPNTNFESSFFFYQKRLHERLALPFTRYFYFKPSTPLDIASKALLKTRSGATGRELGGYTGYGEESWNDEILVGDERSGKVHERGVLVQDARAMMGEGEGEVGELEGRFTER